MQRTIKISIIIFIKMDNCIHIKKIIIIEIFLKQYHEQKGKGKWKRRKRKNQRKN